MFLIEFNQAPPEQLKTLLNNCVHISAWAEKIISERPYSSKAAFLEYAEQLSRLWSWQEIQTALTTHPKIGERQAKKQLNAKEQHFSSKEQAGISLDEQTQQALLQGNLDYEQKFGFIFLIKAAGLSSDEILIKLHKRLQNDLAIEKKIVHEQLAAIALLRLSQEIQA
ncbi:2-oxo-4-hydroxy-4-carboxy-5-ureidoimidazoline decarboxylase [Acinetobacter sp. P1(2023)]|uniref:2-oxo-4-hydroxy-4-carboxy-5-ureidoimidazoline decarboxylase n=1 Tax=unclassified Acinetobacter TaxID=196816 RepID=UPI0021CDCA6A|nr:MULTISPECIES: 2-oxo-4-hydroxy-4-carboxy-5-ureidoimidazoline decarboxylase [unclassified Acinetobacter]MCU4530715.1 2-oxo-4-hydroxy-4-carboxy-5-ureidoimidazoline decarboxylase [Acinetobacter sp. WU_MDCI_Abxe169]MDC0842797.1 2-oxo-4-hydroxy-4-carboxy-5-ureidoimidazoline decarboxylase [Acinetobacter sp. P1(2023)]